MTDSPAPRVEAAPPEQKRQVKYSEMLHYLHRAVIAHEGRIAGLKRFLAEETDARERVTLQAMIDRETIASETAAGTARIIWYLKASKPLRNHLREVVDAEQGYGDAGGDYEMRYDHD